MAGRANDGRRRPADPAAAKPTTTPKKTAKVKTPRRGAPALASNVAALRALAHPTRLRLVELFAEAPRTTKQVADLLGQPPTRLYHHVNLLERAGLLRLRETRANRGAVEKWYEAGPRWSSAASANVPDESGGTAGLALTLLDQSRCELAAALAPGAAEPPLIVRVVAVGAAKRDEVRRRLHALLDELQPARDVPAPRRPSADIERWSLTIAFAPVAPPTPARRPRNSGRERA
jgi:DNA-binding transcriptional ArsR family regulator